MRLRNKETGETGYLELEKGDDGKYTGLRVYKNDFMYKRYDSLAGVLEEWEDYKPAEPLIKDEKIRKAVRAWAEVCGLGYVTYKQASNEFYDPDTRGAFAIRFRLIPVEVYLEDGECYTIAELCGKEEA